jgi:hypothetical protein
MNLISLKNNENSFCIPILSGGNPHFLTLSRREDVVVFTFLSMYLYFSVNKCTTQQQCFSPVNIFLQIRKYFSLQFHSVLMKMLERFCSYISRMYSGVFLWKDKSISISSFDKKELWEHQEHI